MAKRTLALRILAGPLQGRVAALDRGVLVIGRQPGLDLVLNDGLVSRQHARITVDGDRLLVEDLGSTNGTYLNGARIQRARAVEGDRIMVGGSLLKVAAAGGAPAPQRAAPSPSGDRGRARAIEGRLEEVPLSDLLQLFATARKTGVLSLSQDGHSAEIHFENGRLCRCVIDQRADLPPLKTFFRLLTWVAGHFELLPAPLLVSDAAPLVEPLEVLLAEGARHLDEFRRLHPRLPPRLAPSGAPAEGLDEGDRELVALAARHGALQAVLDASPLPDLDVAKRLAVLLTRGVLVAAG